jgi:predicted RecB family nuclease
MTHLITASMLYNLVQCPHRLSLDLHEDPANRDAESNFVRLLWEKGTAFEQEVIRSLRLPFTDLSDKPGDERERLTSEAMDRGDELIYAGRIRADNLLGDPDLLRKQGSGYVAGDIKSGAGEEGASDVSDPKPKRHYAVQLSLYTDILEKKRISAGRFPFIWDVRGREIVYQLDAPQGRRTPETLWQIYDIILKIAEKIASLPSLTRPALCGSCKLCHWHTLCRKRLKEADDLSLIPELGRNRRDAMADHVHTISQLAHADINALITGNKTIFPGIGPATLKKFQNRALLLVDPKARPYLKKKLRLPGARVELFFDIETDPMRDICYLHGFVERTDQDRSTERYVPFFARTPSAGDERDAFSGAYAYVQSKKPCILYFYSKYERTWWRKLQERYPDVATKEQIEAMFDPDTAADLYYDVVSPRSEWPTNDHSIKTLASYLGFKWRDSSPSGAESIEWYHRWIETSDPQIQRRILTYNEDDCLATRVLLDGIRNLKVR